MAVTPVLVALALGFCLIYGKNRRRFQRFLLQIFFKAYRQGGMIIVFASAFLMTRNLGLAALVTFLVYSTFARTFWTNPQAGAGQRRDHSPSVSSLDEAYAVLGLSFSASEDEVQTAYRTLMKRNHPDQGGSTEVASKLNQAKTLILKHLKDQQ